MKEYGSKDIAYIRAFKSEVSEKLQIYDLFFHILIKSKEPENIQASGFFKCTLSPLGLKAPLRCEHLPRSPREVFEDPPCFSCRSRSWTRQLAMVTSLS